MEAETAEEEEKISMGKDTGDTVTHSKTHVPQQSEAQALASCTVVIKGGRPSSARKTLKPE